MQCFIYCRVSTEEQATDNHYSLDNQEQRAQDLAKSKGWRISRVEKDVASGKDDNRRGFKELTAAIRTGAVDCILVYRLDRLSRNVKDIYDFLDLIKKHDTAFVSLTEGFDTTTAMGRAMLGVAAVFAQLTREMIAENVKDGLMRRAQAGLYNGNQHGPYGYRYDKTNNTLVVVPDHAERVREIFRLYADRKWGANKIAAYLNQSSIPGKLGGQWSTETIRGILRQPAYVGKIRWHDQCYDASHEPILPQELWDAAQALIEGRKRIPCRTHQSQHLLCGIAACGRCGKKLVAHYGSQRKDGSRYVFYSHYTDVQRGSCRAFHRSAEKLEKAVLEEIRRATQSRQMESMALEELQEQIVRESAPLNGRRQSIVSELAGLETIFNNWADRLDKGAISEQQFAAQNKRLLMKESELRKELEYIDLTLAQSENAKVSFEAAREALRQFPIIWDDLEIQERRELLRNLIDRLEVHSDAVVMKMVFLPQVTIAI